MNHYELKRLTHLSPRQKAKAIADKARNENRELSAEREDRGAELLGSSQGYRRAVESTVSTHRPPEPIPSIAGTRQTFNWESSMESQLINAALPDCNGR